MNKYYQDNIFNFMYNKFHLAEKPIYLIELFGGIGSQYKSLKLLEKNGFLPKGVIPYKLVEFEPNCIKSYNAIHNTNFDTKDITKIHAEDLEIRERERE